MTTTALTYPTQETLAQSYLNFYRRELIARGVSVASAYAATARGTDRWISANALAQVCGVVLANEHIKEDATFPDTAVGDDLVALAAIYGITPSPGAGATGNVVITCSGTVTYAAGTQATSTKGKRYRVLVLSTVTTGTEIAVEGVDKGTSTDLDAGEVLTWVDPPIGSANTCVVASGGLTNGVDVDNDARLRKRLLQRLREPQNGGSWAHVRRWMTDASAAVEDAWVYPAAQGPGTLHAAYTVVGDRDNDYARAGTTALTSTVAAYVLAQAPEMARAVITTVAHQDLTAAVEVTLPEPISAGGPGGGWINNDDERWPLAFAAGPATVTVTSANVFVVGSATTLPTTNTYVHIFESATRRVRLARVASFTNGAGPPYSVTITLDRSFGDVATGDYIFPASERGSLYADAFQAQVALLAPGEKTGETIVLPRAARHPSTSQGSPSAITTQQLSALERAYPEFQGASFYWLAGSLTITLPSEPNVPSSVTDPPNVWRVLKFAVYPA